MGGLPLGLLTAAGGLFRAVNRPYLSRAQDRAQSALFWMFRQISCGSRVLWATRSDCPQRWEVSIPTDPGVGSFDTNVGSSDTNVGSFDTNVGSFDTEILERRGLLPSDYAGSEPVENFDP